MWTLFESFIGSDLSDTSDQNKRKADEISQGKKNKDKHWFPTESKAFIFLFRVSQCLNYKPI